MNGEGLLLPGQPRKLPFRFRPGHAQALLIELAQKTAEALGGAPLMCRDNYGRDYVKICRIENDEDVRRVVEVFSGLLHEHRRRTSGWKARSEGSCARSTRRSPPTIPGRTPTWGTACGSAATAA